LPIGVVGPQGRRSSSTTPVGVEEHPTEVIGGEGGAAGGGGRSHRLARQRRAHARAVASASADVRVPTGVHRRAQVDHP
jgi:hypothetical protein